MKRINEGAFLAVKSQHKTPLALGGLAAGDPLEAVDDYELLDVNEFITGGKEGIVSYPVTGDSMRETIQPGDIVFVDPFRRPECGDIVVSRLNGKNCIKIYKNSNKGLYLVPKNKNYEARKITKLDDFNILGVVIAHLGVHKR